MHQALYRKWRPRRFADIVGQQDIVTTLKNQIINDRLSHAYILTGIRGTGKTTFARILAKAVNCEHVVDGEPCGECDICKGIDNGSILDVTEVDAASNTGVDNIRELRDETAFTPSVCRRRVYIIDEVHMLSAGAFNALLKIMEEPPAHVMFILATTEIYKVPATILSRCSRFDLKRLTNTDIVKYVQKVCAAEEIEIDGDAAELIARLADGSMRDALSILDTCSSLDRRLTRESVARLAGVTDNSYLFELGDLIAGRDLAAVMELSARLYGDSVDPVRLCRELTRHFRCLMLCKLGGGTLADECSAEELAEYKNAAQKYELQRIFAVIHKLNTAIDSMSRSTDRRLALELALIDLCDESAVAPPAAKAAAEKDAPAAKKPQPRPAPQDSENETRRPANAAAALEPSAQTNQQSAAPQQGELECWGRIVKRVGSGNGALGAFLENSRAFVRENRVLIDAGPIFIDYIRNNEDQKELLKQAITAETGRRMGIGPYSEDAAPAEDPHIDALAEKARALDIDTKIIGG